MHAMMVDAQRIVPAVPASDPIPARVEDVFEWVCPPEFGGDA